MPPLQRSWPELKYPTYYTDPTPISTENWLSGKQTDDGAEGLWRIHDKLYDLRGYVDKHPGGAQWLQLTEGTDCTESFESHHITGKAEAILSKYFVRPASSPRNSPYTFHQDGFYKTLKRKICKQLETLPKESLKEQSKIIMDLLVISTLSLAILAAQWDSYKMAAVAGVFLAFTANSSHNFFHQKNNWRMYYFNLTLMSVRDWRVSHVLSHHAFTNTLQDLEMTSHEPFFKFQPDPEKSWVVRYLSWVYGPLVHAISSPMQGAHRLMGNTWEPSDFIALIIPGLMFLTNGGYIFSAILMWMWLILVSSLIFDANNIGATHHNPKIFIEGDAPRQNRDWGLAQIDATRDSREFRGVLPLVLIAFGEHTMHHLFPAMDHSHLKYLYPTFVETCKEFGVNYKTGNCLSLFAGHFQQLARNKPNRIPPH